MEEGALSAYEAHFLGNGILVNRVAEVITLYEK